MNDDNPAKSATRSPNPGSQAGTDEETVVDTVDARQGGRQKMSIHVLIASMILVALVFVAIWFFLTSRA
jgi:hypothetical protein